MQKTSKPKQIRPEESIFLGTPLIQAVKAKTLELFYKIFIFLQNISSLKSAI